MASAVLVSGGLDSTVLLHYVAKDLKDTPIHALSFNYGQKHSKELDRACWQCEQLSCVKEHKVLDISFFKVIADGASTLVEGGGEVPDLGALDEAQLDQPPTYVPNRNMILLSLAAAFAESRGCRTVYYGAQAQDEYGYWDCTSEFVAHLNQTLALNRRNAVTVRAPFAGLSKSDEVEVGLRLGVNFAHTWTCYRGGDRPCGECPTCVERTSAFRNAGVVDPLMR